MLHKLTASATAGVEKIRIPVDELKLGMFVKELDCPWIDSPFLVHGFVVREQKQLDQLRALCKHVYIDITRDSLSALQKRASKPAQTTEYQTSTSFINNLADSQKIHRKAKAVVANMFEDFRNGKLFEPAAMRTAVSNCVDNIIANPDSMLWLTMIKNKDEYTAEHSLNVALLSITLGRAEGLSVEQLNELGLCAMLHDVGKVKIPHEILNKEGSLEAAQFDVMKMHTVHGKKLLLSQKNLPSAAADIALSHHEKVDGTGYPRGLTAEEIPYLVKIVAIADAYDAMTSGRVYSVAKPAAEALKLLLRSKNQHHDERLLNRFIDCIGVYPIGSIAELNSGEIGIVLPSESEDNLQPVVLVVRDANKQPCKNRYIDLREAMRPDNGRRYMIRTLHPDPSYGIDLASFNDPRFLSPSK
ncbi:MAG: HD-GYP domain-containing protein [Gammaproteobacteria bacterium]|nr:HD-GYP domain-containing protein [Gammaproteobacteria bacterium]